VWARGRCRISLPRFLAECCKRQLNQGSFVLLYFRLFSDLYWVCLSVFSCTVLFVSISQVIGCEDRLRKDLYCVEWGVKLYSNQPASVCVADAVTRCSATRRWLALIRKTISVSWSATIIRSKTDCRHWFHRHCPQTQCTANTNGMQQCMTDCGSHTLVSCCLCLRPSTSSRQTDQSA